MRLKEFSQPKQLNEVSLKQAIAAGLIGISSLTPQYSKSSPTDHQQASTQQVMPAKDQAIANKKIESLLSDLFAYAANYGGYMSFCNQFGCERPDVVVVDLEGDRLAEFRPANPKYLYVSPIAEVGSLDWQNAIVHEFIHYLQLRAGKIHPRMTCDEYVKMEIEAFDVSKAFMKEKGVSVNYDAEISYVKNMCKGR